MQCSCSKRAVSRNKICFTHTHKDKPRGWRAACFELFGLSPFVVCIIVLGIALGVGPRGFGEKFDDEKFDDERDFSF